MTVAVYSLFSFRDPSIFKMYSFADRLIDTGKPIGGTGQPQLGEIPQFLAAAARPAGCKR